VRRGVRFDEVYTGPRVRQGETAALVGQQYTNAGLPWPAATILPELDEHQVDRLIKVAMPQICEEYPEIGKLHAAYRAAESPRDKHRTFQLMFEQLVMLWVRGAVQAPGVESWREFKERVAAGLRRITDREGRGRNVAAFTSVGAVTVSLQVSLQCPDRVAFDLGWRLRNASVTEYLFSSERLTLESFNSLAHLDDGAMWTFR